MFGAILGDIVGSPYEFDRGHKTKGFPLFSEGSVFTDDSVMTIAVADALMRSLNADDDIIRVNLIEGSAIGDTSIGKQDMDSAFFSGC